MSGARTGGADWLTKGILHLPAETGWEVEDAKRSVIAIITVPELAATGEDEADRGGIATCKSVLRNHLGDRPEGAEVVVVRVGGKWRGFPGDRTALGGAKQRRWTHVTAWPTQESPTDRPQCAPPVTSQGLRP